MYLEISKGVFS